MPQPVDHFVGWLARQWLVHAPTRRGRSFILATVFPRLAPEAADFNVRLPGGGLLRARLTESTGWDLLHDRDVERAELTWAITHVGEGDTVIDAGANVGLYSIVLARAVGPTGRVVAFEPVPETVERLRASVQVNGLANVQIEAAAVGDTDARVQFNLAHDSAYSGLAEDPRSPTVSRHVVSMVTIDSVWSSIGEPHVTFVKLDVEGAETKALVGATMLIERCRPLIMAEAAAEDRLEELCGWLSQRGYEQRTPPGFRPYNHLFGPVSSAHEQSSQPVTS